MSNLIFEFKAYNPNKRETYFLHKQYTKYLANSKYVIKNKDANHGLFGKIHEFPNLEKLNDLELVSQYITKLAKSRVPIYRGLISLREYDAMRLGYVNQEKWKELLEGKLVSIAKKMNIKYEELQYAGAVHLEKGHPHLQFFVWSENRINYFIKYSKINTLRNEFINEVFKEDLLPIYQEKDLAKSKIISENYILNKLKNISNDKNFIQDIMKYECGYGKSKILSQTFKDEELKNIVDMLIDLKKDLKKTKGSIKYQYMKAYPSIIEKVDNISREIINLSGDCRLQIENYVLAKQKIVEFKYTNKEKLNLAKDQIKKESEEEILKLVGNKILDFERALLNEKEKYAQQRYYNESRKLVIDVFNALCTISYQKDASYKQIKMKYKKQLSKQAKKEKAIEKRNCSSWSWEEEL